MKESSSIRFTLAVAALATLMLITGCRRPPEPPPPPPPPPPAPTATLSANPSNVQQGQPVTLTWRTENAEEVTIEGIGTVEASGTRSVTPQQSTTYQLVARGPGGTQEASARVTVTVPPPPPPPAPAPAPPMSEMFAQNVQDVFFDFDRYDLRPEAQETLRRTADFLRQNANVRFTIEGHADERGSTEYNLALGDNRASAARDFLVQLGIDANRIQVISFGKEKPFCTESTEECWQQNRRAHFVYRP